MEHFISEFVLKMMSKYFPPTRPMPTQEEFSDRQVTKWNFIALPLFLLFASICGGFAWLLGVALSRNYHALIAPPSVLVGVSEEAYAIPAIFAGIALSVLPLSFVLKKLLKERYDLYMLAATRHYGGYDPDRVMRFFGTFTAVACAIGMAMLLQIKFALYDDKLVWCGAIYCESHDYGEISEYGIAAKFTAPNGTTKKAKNLVVRFGDNSLWTPSLLRDDPKLPQIEKLLKEKTNLPLLQFEIAPDK